jgi:hypothetical protein
LDKEIKKIYIFFSRKEKELYKSINSHLHIKQSYENFGLSNLKKEIFEIEKLTNSALKISNFVELNLTAIKKILKKFDKKFSSYFSRISFSYIKKKLESKHSDLTYLITLKIIDEVSAITEDLIKTLKFFVKKKVKEEYTKNSNGLTEKLNNDFFQEEKNTSNAINEKEIEESFGKIESNLFSIDEINLRFRNSFKDWSNKLKNTNKAIDNINSNSITSRVSLFGFAFAADEANNEKSPDYKNLDIEDNRSSNSRTNSESSGNSSNSGILNFRKDSVDSEYIFSDENSKNIFITLAHSFIFMFAYSIVIPTNCIFIHKMSTEKFYSGLALGMTPIGSIFSLFISKKMINSSFKLPLVFSTLLFLTSSILYILAGTSQSFFLVLISRFLLGLGSLRFINRTYLVLFINQSNVSKYLFYYQLSSLLGLASGPLVSIPLSLIGEDDSFSDGKINELFNESTLPCWLLLIINAILLIIIIANFTEPLNGKFLAFKNSIQEIKSIDLQRERLSIRDQTMIANIDNRLNEINDSSSFSDTNLVSKELQQIAKKESNSNSYLYNCFIVFFIMIVIVRVNFIKF